MADPTGGAYSAPPDPLAGADEARCPLFKNPTSRFRPRGPTDPHCFFDKWNTGYAVFGVLMQLLRDFQTLSEETHLTLYSAEAIIVPHRIV